MLNKIAGFTIALALTGVLMVAGITSCNKQKAAPPTQNKSINATSQRLPGWYYVHRGTLSKDNEGFMNCDPDLTSFCHITDGVGYLPGQHDVVNIDVISGTVVHIVNTATAGLGSINPTLANDLPASAAAAAGVTSITINPGIYPMIVDPAHPNGYYVVSVTTVP